MLRFIILITICLSTFSQDRFKDKPKLVVGIVVDMMRYDFIERFKNRFSTDGFNRLIKEGFQFKNAHLNYLPTLTAPGLASINTGTTPSIHGIIGNTWFDRYADLPTTNVIDTTYDIVGSQRKFHLVLLLKK